MQNEETRQDQLAEDKAIVPPTTVTQRDAENVLSQEGVGLPLGEYHVTPGMPALLRRSAAEGMVLLKNDGLLPLDPERRVAVFGRCQLDTFYVGYGSGGDVKPPYLISIIQGLEENGQFRLNARLLETYREWTSLPENRPPAESAWGRWPLNYPEMPLTDEQVKKAAGESETAVLVLGRAAGEDREVVLEKGSYYLTDDETRLLDQVTEAFDHVVVLVNAGNIIDLGWTEHYGDKISALVYIWQGGMETGHAVADILSGIVNPGGRLPAAIARHYEDYPSSSHFGDPVYNNYEEDIFVGYRYFETFAQDKVLYPFGFGLSYTTFELTPEGLDRTEDGSMVRVKVRNTGSRAGREVVQLYLEAPQGKLGKASRHLAAFARTPEIMPGAEVTVELAFGDRYIASYDDLGKTGHRSAYVLEAGEYRLHAGQSVRRTVPAGSFTLAETLVFEQLEEVLSVKDPFERLVAVGEGETLKEGREDVPAGRADLRQRILDRLPRELPVPVRPVTDFREVQAGTASLEDFIASLSEAELEALTRGEGGMNSSLGTPGNAGAFGGIIPSLREKNVKPIITTDGPAGIRLQRYCSLLPCGTALASTWDTELLAELHAKVGEEMNYYGSEVLLAPGINIHRNPLCGRNFEYYSEDPLLSGRIAAAAVRGLQSQDVSACPKHFAANNQETKRNTNDSRVSERALREIYLRSFEVCVRESKPRNLMTSYNKINGVWAHYNYDLATTVLRGEWGYEGNIVTDWWMQKDVSPEFPKIRNNSYRVRAQVDVLMPGGIVFEETEYRSDGTLLESLGEEDGITLAELQRTALNVLRFVKFRMEKEAAK